MTNNPKLLLGAGAVALTFMYFRNRKKRENGFILAANKPVGGKEYKSDVPAEKTSDRNRR